MLRRLREVMAEQVSAQERLDRIVVLDRGMVAGEFNKADVTLEELIDRLYLVARTGRLAAASGGDA